MKIARRPWTAKDDELLRRFHAESKSDEAIGYIIGRHRVVIQRHRVKLKLPAVAKAGSRPGWQHTPETLARMSEALRQRWARPGYRETHGQHIHQARAAYLQKRFRRPPKGTQEHRLYNKLCEALGPEQARQEMGL